MSLALPLKNKVAGGIGDSAQPLNLTLGVPEALLEDQDAAAAAQGVAVKAAGLAGDEGSGRSEPCSLGKLSMASRCSSDATCA